MTNLSPAAQAVLDAVMQYEINPECYSREIAAAALRAVVEQVMPLERTFGGGFRQHRSATAERRENRRQILAIVAELEAQQ